MKISILTTDEAMTQFISKHVSEYGLLKQINIKVVAFRSTKKFLNLDEDFDILFVDVTVDSESAIETAKLVRAERPDQVIVVISANSQDVYDVFPLKAYRFLIKPLSVSQLIESIESFRRDQFSDKFIIAKTEKGYHSFCMSDIVYIKADGKRTLLITLNKTVSVITPYNQIAEQLSEDSFFNCSRSYYVNMNFVQQFDATRIILRSNEVIPLSRRKKMDFYIKYNQYVKSHTF